MSRKRIVLAVTIDDSLQFLKGLPVYLVERGWEVHVVSGGGPRLDELTRLPHVHTHTISMRRDPSLFSDCRALGKWLRLVRRVRPDVVSVGTPKAGLLGTLAAFILRVPGRVYLLRGLRLETSTNTKRKVLEVAEWLTMACSTHVISVSKSLRQKALELRLVSPAKIRVLGKGSSNGTDVDNFNPARFSLEDRRQLMEEAGLLPGVPVVGFVGRLTRDKGVHVLADALQMLASSGPTVQALIVGGVDDATGAEGLERLKASQVHTVTTGHVSDPAAYYALMDILCLPSYREGFVNVVIEAAASGVPAVVSDATGVVDTVLHGVTGLISPVGDPGPLATNLRILFADPAVASRMGQEGRRWVLENFDRRSVQRNYADEMERVATSKVTAPFVTTFSCSPSRSTDRHERQR